MSNTHTNNFGVIRLVAALFVLRGHMQYLLGLTPITFFGAGIENIGVKIFFLIGGYLITKSWLSDQDPLRYTIKRVLRIWPPLIVCVAFSALIIGPLCTQMPVGEYFSSMGLWKYFRILLLYICYDLPGVFIDNPYPVAVNGSLWTLPIEVFMYLVIAVWFGLLAKCGGKRANQFQQVGALVLMGAVAVLSFVLYPRGIVQNFVFYGVSIGQMLTLIPYYIIGSLYATVIPRKILNLPAAISIFLVGNCFFISWSTMHELFRMIILSYLIFSLAFATPALSLPKWTEISYGIYLFGFPIQQMVVWFAKNHGWPLTHSNAMTALCMIPVILLAFASKFLVEDPANRLCRKICSALKQRGTMSEHNA